VPNNTERVPDVPSDTVEKKLLHQFLLLLLTLAAMGKAYPPNSKTAWQGEDGCHTTPKRCRTPVERSRLDMSESLTGYYVHVCSCHFMSMFAVGMCRLESVESVDPWDSWCLTDVLNESSPCAIRPPRSS